MRSEPLQVAIKRDFEFPIQDPGLLEGRFLLQKPFGRAGQPREILILLVVL